MALFFFVSGYFYGEDHRVSVPGFLTKRAIRLLVPYFIWNLIYGLLASALSLLFGFFPQTKLSFSTLFIEPWTTGHQFFFNIPAWFLLTLFIAQAFYVGIRWIGGRAGVYESTAVWTIVAGMGVSAVLIPYRTSPPSGFTLVYVKAAFGLVFYHLGAVYGAKLERFDVFSPWRILFVCVLQTGLFLLFNGKLDYSLAFGHFYDRLVLPYATSLIGIWLNLQAAAVLPKLGTAASWLLPIGRSSYHVMMHHLLGFWILNSLYFLLYTLGAAWFAEFDVQTYFRHIYCIHRIKHPISVLAYAIAGVAAAFLLKAVAERFSGSAGRRLTECLTFFQVLCRRSNG